MPVFNVIRVHHQHIIKVKSMRNGLHEDCILSDKENGLTNIQNIKFNNWRKHIVKTLNKRKPLASYKIEHIYH